MAHNQIQMFDDGLDNKDSSPIEKEAHLTTIHLFVYENEERDISMKYSIIETLTWLKEVR